MQGGGGGGAREPAPDRGGSATTKPLTRHASEGGEDTFASMESIDTVSPILFLAAGITVGLVVAYLYAMIWKVKYTRIIRDDSVQRSRATISGQVHEQLLPYLPDFPFDPKDVRFLGSPVDLLVFDGLNAGKLERIVFIEIKTGNAHLNTRERQVRDMVLARGVSWEEIRR